MSRSAHETRAGSPGCRRVLAAIEGKARRADDVVAALNTGGDILFGVVHGRPSNAGTASIVCHSADALTSSALPVSGPGYLKPGDRSPSVPAVFVDVSAGHEHKAVPNEPN